MYLTRQVKSYIQLLLFKFNCLKTILKFTVLLINIAQYSDLDAIVKNKTAEKNPEKAIKDASKLIETIVPSVEAVAAVSEIVVTANKTGTTSLNVLKGTVSITESMGNWLEDFFDEDESSEEDDASDDSIITDIFDATYQVLNVIDDLLSRVFYVGEKLSIIETGVAAISVQSEKPIDSVHVKIKNTDNENDKGDEEDDVILTVNSKNDSLDGDYFYFKNSNNSIKNEQKLSIISLTKNNFLKNDKKLPIVSNIVKINLKKNKSEDENNEDIETEAHIQIDHRKLNEITRKNSNINKKFICGQYNNEKKIWKKYPAELLKNKKIKCTFNRFAHYAILLVRIIK